MEARRWHELRAAADLLAQVTFARPVLIELLRPQTLFNHALLDLLERWPQVAPTSDLPGELRRLEVLAVARAAPVRSHRGGLRGALIGLAKQAAMPVLETALHASLLAQREVNLARVTALYEKRPSLASTQSRFEPQARFDALLDGALPEILRIDSYAAAYREWVSRVEPSLPPPPPVSAPPKVTVFCEGSPATATVAALLEQKSDWTCVVQKGPVPLHPRFRVGTLESVKSEWVLWVSEDVELDRLALPWFSTCTDVDLAYADEDEVGRTNPFFKPAFCSELARERDLLGGAVWARRSAVRGGKPLDWALALPASRIRRVARVLTHRTKPVSFSQRVVREVPAGAKVSVVVPFRDKPELLVQLLRSVERFEPGVEVEWLFVDNGSKVAMPPLPGRVLRDDGPFNWSRLNNLAAREATGTHLLFLNNDVEAASHGWLKVLMEYACQDDVGVVGANLLYPDGTLQHAGVALGVKGLAGHVFARHREGATPFGSPFQTRQVSAVTGACLLVRRSLFETIGGFDERLPITGGDVELCLRTGLRVLNVPHVKLVHHESLSRSGMGLSNENLTLEKAAYEKHLPDRFYNPNLTTVFTCCTPDLER